jgi:hypothetical protein
MILRFGGNFRLQLSADAYTLGVSHHGRLIQIQEVERRISVWGGSQPRAPGAAPECCLQLLHVNLVLSDLFPKLKSVGK